MAEIIINNKACLVKMSDEELNFYGELYLRLKPLTMTFEGFCRKNVLDDLKILEDRRYQELIWHREVERELNHRALTGKEPTPAPLPRGDLSINAPFGRGIK